MTYQVISKIQEGILDDITGSLIVENYLWNVETLSWEPATKGTGIGQIVSVDNWPASISGPTVHVTDDPLSKYKITDMDETDSIAYYGFVDPDGKWFIRKFYQDLGIIRYAKGDSDYISNWNNRANLTYDYFYNVF